MKSKYLSPIPIGLLMGFIALTIDQATKTLALLNSTKLVSGLNIFPGFNLILLHNPGISFGMLGNVPWWVLTLIGLVICTIVAVLLWQTEDHLEAVGYGFIIGGALGNIIDRLRYGAVTDFLDFYYGDTHWPAFNFADTFVFMGAAAIILSTYFASRKKSACDTNA